MTHQFWEELKPTTRMHQFLSHLENQIEHPLFQSSQLLASLAENTWDPHLGFSGDLYFQKSFFHKIFSPPIKPLNKQTLLKSLFCCFFFFFFAWDFKPSPRGNAGGPAGGCPASTPGDGCDVKRRGAGGVFGGGVFVFFFSWFLVSFWWFLMVFDGFLVSF